MLGLSAAFGGRWVERAGPRKAMALAATCWGSGFLIGAVGVATTQLWIVYLGIGVIGGIGLGIGYISPVSTLIKWFPDRPGMATGLAIMGFGGGAIIASPLENSLLSTVRRPAGGRARRIVRRARLHLLRGDDARRDGRPGPGRGLAARGLDAAASAAQRSMITSANVTATTAIKTPQFWLLWTVLFCNVTAGIGILEQAAPMIQDFFPQRHRGGGGRLRRPAVAVQHERPLRVVLDVGRVGRKPIYMGYLGIGAICYLLLATAGTASVAVFVLFTGIILSFYGGGFATVPAYLKDLFGTIEVGAIHGRLLTAWSAAGIAGPLIVNGLADHETSVGKSGADLYTISLLHHGRRPRRRLHRQPDDPAGRTSRFHEPATEPADDEERFVRDGEPATASPMPQHDDDAGASHERHDDARPRRRRGAGDAKGSAALAIFLWVVVTCALVYGLYNTFIKVVDLFSG